jgi:hypothetical protein
MLVLHFNILTRLKTHSRSLPWGQEFYSGRGGLMWLKWVFLSQAMLVFFLDLKIASVPQPKLLLSVRTACVMQLYWNSLRFYWPFAGASLPTKNVCVSVLVVSTRRAGVRDTDREKSTSEPFHFSPRPAGAFEGRRKYLWYVRAAKRRGCFTAQRSSPESQVEVQGEKKIT